ncbi:MAG: DNA-3-methyladenine glycosylase [Bernardetiaceae bacterium]|jgi:DNA-3-methyladenine glycosylase|nr:DNA-3-methyladenine glycosylase [Bernardetiaceae bacterium]
MPKLPPDFYLNPDVVAVARQLLGKHLFTCWEGALTGGRIVETEAYAAHDRACHAYQGRRTARTEVMFGPGGHAYVYLCYGMHQMFNIVTHGAGVPAAVLVRAIEPTEGLATMLHRRRMAAVAPRLTAGPGAVGQALGLHTRHSGLSLLGDQVWLEDGGPAPELITASPRVGVGYAGPDAQLPWRFRVAGNPWCSRAK